MLIYVKSKGKFPWEHYVVWTEKKKHKGLFRSILFCFNSFFRLRAPGGGERGGGVLELIFAGYVPLASQSSYSITVYSMAKYKHHLSHLGKYVIFAIPA